MIPKEKAKELVYNFEMVERSKEWEDSINLFEAKQCALLSVNEIIEALGSNRIIYGSEYRNEETDYWETVKEEINKL